MKPAKNVGQQSAEDVFRAGLGLFEQGRLEEAAACFERVAAGCPALPEAWRNLGAIRLHQGLTREAEPLLREAIRLRPQFAEAYNDLGHCLQLLERWEDAEDCFRVALRLMPTLAEAHLNLAQTMRKQGRLDEAVSAYQEALRLRPGWAAALCPLGSVLIALHRYQEAAEQCRRAIQADPGMAEAYNLLGVVQECQGELDAAIQSYRRAVQLRPQFPQALNNYGAMLARFGRLKEAEDHLRAVLAATPDYAQAWNNLAHVLERRGGVGEALACYRRAVRLSPGFAAAHSNLLLAMHYDPEAGPEEIFEEHRRWAASHAAPLAAKVREHVNRPLPERRVRLGYLSPDFRKHAVAFFIEPVLAAHNREKFEVICYTSSAVKDDVTARLRGLPEGWRDVHALYDEQAAELIRRDGVDILVDLAGHTAGGRPLLCALKPAPVQVNWLGYPDTTGLETVDYRITDELADPPGLTERFHTEQLVRLPAPFLCYLPPREAPPVAPSPVLTRGHITFGAFHNLAKINRQVASLWAEILRAVAGSRLLIKSRALDEESTRAALRRLFAECGAPVEQLELRGSAPNWSEHLAAYAEVDIALDTFPYAGTTTTCEALWMGVPVVTLVGATHVARTGLSLLASVGLEELAAHSPAAYVACALRLASDPARLAQLRAGLRARMAQSPLTDARRFTGELERAYRQMWRAWCEGKRA